MSRKTTFVCSVCHAIVDWHLHRFEERIEVRNVSHTESLGQSPVVAYYCREHALERVKELKGVQSSSEQGALL